MGSAIPGSELPEASSPTLVLTNPTSTERDKTWSHTHPIWGGALNHDHYLKREAYLTTIPLAKDGGVTQWILTDGSLSPDQRPVLSSCETLRKRALACRPGGELEGGIAHGIGSVFTQEKFRGKGYAGRMMRELGKVLGAGQAGEGKALFSVLYSDIGKVFYASKGWAPFESSHLVFQQASAAETNGNGIGNSIDVGSGINGDNKRASPIGYHEFAELCAVDEKLIRTQLKKRADRHDGRKTSVALIPDLDAILWHLMREDFMTKHIFGRTPSTKGAVYGEVGRRLWAVWTRGYYGNPDEEQGNTLHILRFVVEDDECSDEYLVEGFRAVIRVAQTEARDWKAQNVHMWNPTPVLKRLVEKSGLTYELVDRDSESIASLMWYGDGATTDLDWMVNEKFGWC